MVPNDSEAQTRPHRSVAETVRQLIHILSGLWAFTLHWLEPWPLILLALSATVFNLWLLPRFGGRWLWRDHEIAAGRAIGVVIYPLTVLTLLTIFYRRPEVAAAGWGLLAFGDGAATLVGRRWGRRGLPWNPAKTWSGFIAYIVVGWAAVGLLVSWTAPGLYNPVVLFWVSGAVALLGAWLESVPLQLDDNLAGPLVAALLLFCGLQSGDGWQRVSEAGFAQRALLGLGINLALVGMARALGTLTTSGSMAALWIGSFVWAFLSWRGFGVLVVFFVLGSAATRVGYATKDRRRLAEGRGGRRRAANALANGGVAPACAVFAGLSPDTSIFLFAFACSLAAAAADTVESEIGQVWGRPTVLITTLAPVAPGTDGGISTVGTLAGLLAAVVTVGAGWLLGLYSWALIVPLSLLALVATLIESLIGATLERGGLVENHGVNFLNTLLAALLGAAWAWIMG